MTENTQPLEGEVVSLTIPNQETIIRPVEALVSVALTNAVEDVDSPEMKMMVLSQTQEMRDKREALENLRVFTKAPSLEAGRRVDALFNPAIHRYDEGIAHNKQVLYAVEQKEEAQRRAEQRRIEDEQRRAREAAEAEAARLRDEAEREAAHLAREAQHAAEEGDVAEAERLTEEAHARVETAAEDAREIIEHAQTAPVILPPVAKLPGMSTRKKYEHEVVDFDALIDFVAANKPLFRHLLEPAQKALDAQARAMKENFSIPGCRLKIDGIVVLR